MSGRLIVFEGVEGCGKTTQLQLLHEWLQRLFSTQAVTSLIVTREPGGTPLGLGLRQLLCEDNGRLLEDERFADRVSARKLSSESLIRKQALTIQDSAELLLYAADRAQHVEEVLKPQLALGAIILCDRYTDSTIAYQGYGRGLSLSLIHQLNWIATGGLESDLTLWLDVDVEVGLARTKSRGWLDRIEQADLKFHEQVQQGYIQLAKAHPKRIVRVDASLSQENVQQQIRLILSQRFAEWGLSGG